MSLPISFFVPGIPKPGGSKTGFYNKKLNRVLMVDASDNKDWKSSVKSFAKDIYTGPPLIGALCLAVEFRVMRPNGHYGTGKKVGIIKESAPLWPTKKPDCTKLLRALEDALTGIIWRDDCQIVEQHVTKVYAETPGANVQIAEKKRYVIPLT